MDTRRRISFNVNTGDTSGSIDTSNYMTILALEDGLTAKLSDNACQYCIDGDGNWIDLPKGTTTQAINQGQTLSFKGNLIPNSWFGIGTFTISKKCNLEGNCMAMLFGDNAADNFSLSGKSYAFHQLFSGCTTIIQVSETFLPATTLADSCYRNMFEDCTSLTTAPELPATTLTSLCYAYMFHDCTSLTVAPELPATTLYSSCYSSMFKGCTSLTVAPELPATTLANYCYQHMFLDCTSLTVAPKLPATKLYNYCYNNMFSSCSKLNYIKMLATNVSASSCLSSWVYGVASTGTFVKNPAMTSLPTGNSGIPSGWTIVDDNQFIMYTSSDGNIITPKNTSVFGATIINNVYINGKGYITFDGPVTTIGDTAFDGCGLTSIIIPDSVTTIGYAAFHKCKSLTSVNIPDSVTSFGKYAFYECDSLTSVNIPNSVTSIGEWAFGYCSGLTSITIPDSVTSIEYGAFAGCSNLTSVYCKATTPPSLGSYVFDNNGLGRKIYVPAGSVNAYKNATNWSGHANVIVGYDFEDGGVNLITFTIAGTEYQAEEGMTWEQWVYSEYNTHNFSAFGNNVTTYEGSAFVSFEGIFETKTATIIDSRTYILNTIN